VEKNRACSFQIDCIRPDADERETVLATDGNAESTLLPLPEDVGRGHIRIDLLRENLGFDELILTQAKEPCSMNAAVRDTYYKFPLILEANAVELVVETETGQYLLDPHSSYMLSPCIQGEVHIHSAGRLDQFCFFIPPSLLEILIAEDDIRLVPFLENGLETLQREPFLHCSKATPAMRRLVEQIRTCRMRGSLRGFFLEAKMLEFLALRLQPFSKSGCENCTVREYRFGKKERDRLYEARDILMADWRNPPTITRLSRQVGLNTTKLKRGFKITFGCTLFEFTHQLRMQRALALLQDTDMSIGEVAREVGYGSLSAFSAAFHREIGFRPSSFRQ
jgi:AraC-like DNA-binding protein